MTKDQGYGIIERLLYGAILWVAMKFVAKGYIDTEMAAYIAAGGVAAAGSIYAWVHNAPGSLLTRASAPLPVDAKLVITTAPGASPAVKQEARALADSAGDKVVAKTG